MPGMTPSYCAGDGQAGGQHGRLQLGVLKRKARWARLTTIAVRLIGAVARAVRLNGAVACQDACEQEAGRPRSRAKIIATGTAGVSHPPSRVACRCGLTRCRSLPQMQVDVILSTTSCENWEIWLGWRRRQCSEAGTA